MPEANHYTLVLVDRFAAEVARLIEATDGDGMVPAGDQGSPITRPSMVCSCLIGSSFSTRRAGRCVRAPSGIDS